VVKASSSSWWKCARAGGACAPETACETCAAYSRERLWRGRRKRPPVSRKIGHRAASPPANEPVYLLLWCLRRVERIISWRRRGDDRGNGEQIVTGPRISTYTPAVLVCVAHYTNPHAVAMTGKAALAVVLLMCLSQAIDNCKYIICT